MADLRDVVGAILRDVTEARGQADEAARDMALVYAKDPILRAFTIPRIEIRDLHIDLKVAVRGVSESAEDSAKREQRIAEACRAIIKQLPFAVDDATVRTLIALAGPTLTLDTIEKELSVSARAAASNNAESVKIELYRDVLLIAEKGDTDIRIVSFTTDVVAPSTRFTSLIDARKGADQISKLRAGQALTPQQLKLADGQIRIERQSIAKRFTAAYAQAIETCAAQLLSSVKAVLSSPTEKRINLEVITADLKEIPQHMISTISLTLDVNGILPTQTEEV
jgi:hypothetical protein